MLSQTMHHTQVGGNSRDAKVKVKVSVSVLELNFEARNRQTDGRTDSHRPSFYNAS